MQRIYLDNNATTPLDPRVFRAMLLDLNGPPANPSSVHWFGKQARNLLSNARRTVASFLNATPEEILFTSGGTESLNHLLRALRGPLITTSIEHSAIYRTLPPSDVTYLPVGLSGAPLPADLAAAIRPSTTAIILSACNNETGVKIDLPSFAAIAEKHHIPLLLDAVAYIGKEPLSIPPGVTALALSAHKFHAPKGVGVLFHRPHLKLSPLLTGGSQENLQRAGTENLSGILGLAEALTILTENQPAITHHLTTLRDHFEKQLLHNLPDLLIHGQNSPRIANTSNMAFLGLDGETLLLQLDLHGIAASHGSACASGALEPSRVLTKMGIDRKTARSSLRFSFSRMNTIEEIDRAIEIIVDVVKKMRKI